MTRQVCLVKSVVQGVGGRFDGRCRSVEHPTFCTFDLLSPWALLCSISMAKLFFYSLLQGLFCFFSQFLQNINSAPNHLDK